jgi:hypothetical protein
LRFVNKNPFGIFFAWFMGKEAAIGIFIGVAHFSFSYIFSFNCAKDNYSTFTQMKFFTLIFNIYLLALAFFPCADVDSCVETNDNYISATDNKKEDHKEAENCTPFCICACCAIPIIHQPISADEVSKQIYFAAKYPSLKIHYPSYSSASIWQPPKFC